MYTHTYACAHTYIYIYWSTVWLLKGEISVPCSNINDPKKHCAKGNKPEAEKANPIHCCWTGHKENGKAGQSFH